VWLNSVRTGRARSKIRHYLKNMEYDESRTMGEKMLAQALRAEGLLLPADDPPMPWPQRLAAAGARFRQPRPRRTAGRHRLGRKIANIVAKRLAQLMIERGFKPDAMTMTMGLYAQDESVPTQGVVFVDGNEGSSVRLAPCCRPIPATTSSATSAAARA